MDNDTNNWNEYAKYVLKELEKLNASQERPSEKIQELRDSLDSKLATALKEIREDLNNLQSKVAHFEPNKVVQLQVEVENLKESTKDQDERVRKMEISNSSFGGKWSVISAVGAVVLSALISMLFGMAKAETSAVPEKPPVTKTAD